MAFWGVEVKPGKPFIHSPKNGQRLHLSQATLGSGSSTKKSTVQCNIGNSSPVFLCSLFPEKIEVSQLNLEYEESVDVTFSVIGPQSVHLSGYYCLHSSSQHYHRDDESESYGQDLGDADTERSADGSDEDDYEDSFINDDDDGLEVIPPSPVSGCRDVMFDMKKPNNGKGNRRRLNKCQVVESDDEDKLPISLLCDGKSNGKGSGLETKEKDAKVKGKTCKETKADGSLVSVSKGKSDAAVDLEPKMHIDHCNSIQPSSEVGLQNVVESDNKGEKHRKEERQLECAAEDDFFFGMVLGRDKSKQSEIEAETSRGALPMSEEAGQKTAKNKNAEKTKKKREKGAKVAKSQETKDDGSLVSVSEGKSDAVVDVKSKMQIEHQNFVKPSSEAGLQNVAESDKKEERHHKEEKQHKVGDEDGFFFATCFGQDKSKQSEIEAETLGQALPMGEEEGQKIANDKNAGKAKKKREKDAKVAKSQQMTEHECLQVEAEAKNAGQHMLATDNENQKLTNDQLVNENLQADAEAKYAGQHVLVTENENQKLTNVKGDEFLHLTENVAKPKKKKRNRVKEEKSFESEDPLTYGVGVRDDQPKVDVVPENVEKPKKKKRKQAKEEKSFKVDGPLDCGDVTIEDQAQQDQAKAEIFEQPLPTIEVDPKQANYETFDLDHSVDDKKKQKNKRKKNEEDKKSGTQENGDDLVVESKIGNQDGNIAAPGE